MNKAGVAVAGFCCKSCKVELLKGIGFDPFDDLIQDMEVQVAGRMGVLSRNAPVHEGEEARSEACARCSV
jgi:hypothetical protein